MGDRLTTIDIGRKVEGAAEPLSVGGAGSSSNTMWPWAEAYSIPNGILIHPAVWLQQIWAENWGLSLFYRGGFGSLCNTMSLGPRPISLPSDILIHPAILRQQIWAENWGLCPFRKEGAGSPSNTMRPWPRPTPHAKFHLDTPNRLATKTPQYTSITDRRDSTVRRSDSIGRTVVQAVAQKRHKIQHFTKLNQN